MYVHMLISLQFKKDSWIFKCGLHWCMTLSHMSAYVHHTGVFVMYCVVCCPHRPGSIQTRQQIEIVQQFSLFLSPLCRFYPADSAQLTLHQYLYNQSLMLHGYELQDLKFIPKVMVCIEQCSVVRGRRLRGRQSCIQSESQLTCIVPSTGCSRHMH